MKPRQNNQGIFVGSKHHLADKNYGFDWRADSWLEADETISASDWEVDAQDVTISRKATNPAGTVTSCFIAGGTPGQDVKLTNIVTTSKGVTDAKTWLITITSA